MVLSSDWFMRSLRLLTVAVLAVLLAASMFNPVAAQTGYIVIGKTGYGTTQFHFALSNGTFTPVFYLAHEDVWNSPILANGDYTVLEDVLAGWVLSLIICSRQGGTESTWEYVPGGCTGPCQGGVTIHLLGENEGVGCTFYNSPVGPVGAEKPVGGLVMPVNTSAVLALWLAVIAVVGGIGTVVVVARKRRL
jgi:hypothetical protein